MCRTNSSGYETPWTAWGVEEEEEEKKQVGNIKLGPKNIRCPEDARGSKSLTVKKVLFWAHSIVNFFVPSVKVLI